MISLLKRLIPDRHPIRLGWHKAKAFAAAVRYGFPGRKLTVIGVTGTDGKTTTVGMITHILHHSNVKVGALSTAFFQMGDDIIWNETQKTSPSPFVIQKFLKNLVSQGYTHAVLEYSSHGLVQGRTNHTYPSVCTVTNTSMEHLDYHKTMDQYQKDKGILFDMLTGKRVKVLNIDDSSYAQYKDSSSLETYTFGLEQCTTNNNHHFWLSEVVTHPSSSSATIHDGSATSKLQLPLPGSFNLLNAMCAIACTTACGIPLDQSAKALESFEGMPGRMEKIDEGQDFSVYVDFTVTPGSYEQTLTTLRGMIESGKRILVLTGSCGDRMKEKRPIIGKICSELADVVVVSNEDPYTEDPQTIIEEVWSGIDASITDAHKIFDRKEAISFLLQSAQSGDAVLLAGKGSDTTMWVASGQIPWNERAIVREILHTLK